ncbi:ERCC4-type nuclease [Candidatus Bathyarchaeota archaeon]|nr:ERCC4-type nuclease [Candidatus Bathyarchaeota archaeon]
MNLLVDHRERHLKELVQGVCAETALAQLPIGDYLVIGESGATLVERKTVKDFFSSARSNRLWDQMLRMMKAEKVLGHRIRRRILVIHGDFMDYWRMIGYGREESMSTRWCQLMGAFMEIVYVYNTPIIYAEDDTAFKAFMRILIQREATGKNDKSPDARWYRKPVKADLPVKDRKKYILSALPYIGDRLAENLLQHFCTISGVACASIKELQKVPKIGKKKAGLIYKMFH